jgi:hypothetical protein
MIDTTAPMLSIVTDEGCIGFILRRGKAGYEAFREEGSSLGIFQTQQQAADAIYAGQRLGDDATEVLRA